jgi:hypothetical protein
MEQLIITVNAQNVSLLLFNFKSPEKIDTDFSSQTSLDVTVIDMFKFNQCVGII